MFGQIGQMVSALKNLPKLKAQMDEFQKKLGEITAEGNAGGGLVTAKANGRMEILACRITEDAMKLQDREMLEDLIAAAVNQALAKVREQVAEETGKIAANLGLPAGTGLPGLG